MIAALVLAHVLVVTPPELSTDDAAAKYQSACAGKKTPECKQLQWQLEYALFQDLRLAEEAGQPIEDDTVMLAGAADCPQLKTFALTHWRNTDLPAAAKPLVVAALNDPYPTVREAAFELTYKLDAKYQKYGDRRVSRSHSSRLPSADPLPPEKLAAPVYAGAAYLYYASEPSKASLFNTADQSDKVAAYYKGLGKSVITGAEMKKRSDAANAAMKSNQQDPMAMARAMQAAMQSGKDPQTVIAEMQAGAVASGVAGALVQEYEGKQDRGIKNTRYVILDEKKQGSATVVANALVLFDDAYLGGTTIVFPTIMTGDDLAKMNAAAMGGAGGQDYMKQMQSRQKAQEILNDPDAQP